MDSFYAVPTSTTYSPFTSSSSIVVEDIITPLNPIVPYASRTIFSNMPRVGVVGYNTGYNTGYYPGYNTGYNTGYSTVYKANPQGMYYYDSGIGENPIARHETNVDLRYKFLDKWLYRDEHQNILKMLKVDGKTVKVLSKSESEKNDISKDTESDLERKSDFIGMEILTLEKNRKILDTLCRKNSLKYYDLPHNEKYVVRAQSRYVKSKLEEMQK
jgi:hypothetical protein